jgi:hypothetical protein
MSSNIEYTVNMLKSTGAKMLGDELDILNDRTKGRAVRHLGFYSLYH